MIDIIFLGTGSSVPTLRRNHPAILLKYKAETMLFDCGEGTQKQFRKAGISPMSVKRIFITHWHGDHILGLPGLLQTLVLNGYDKEMGIYGPKGSKDYMQKILGMFVHVGEIKVSVHEVTNGKVFATEDFEILAEEMKHNARCLAYSFVEKDRIRIDKNKLKKFKIPNSPVLQKLKQGKDIIINGKKIKAKEITYINKGKKISIVLDTQINDNIEKIAKNSDLLICESTYLDEEETAKQYKHMTARQAAQVAKKSKVQKLVLMHLSQKYEKKENEFLKEARKIFKNTEIAEDLMKVSV